MQTVFSAIPRSGMREAAAMPVATSDTRAGSIPADSNRTLFGGSYYTYEDDVCVRGQHQAAWRIVFH